MAGGEAGVAADLGLGLRRTRGLTTRTFLVSSGFPGTFVFLVRTAVVKEASLRTSTGGRRSGAGDGEAGGEEAGNRIGERENETGGEGGGATVVVVVVVVVLSLETAEPGVRGPTVPRARYSAKVIFLLTGSLAAEEEEEGERETLAAVVVVVVLLSLATAEPAVRGLIGPRARYSAKLIFLTIGALAAEAEEGEEREGEPETMVADIVAVKRK